MDQAEAIRQMKENPELVIKSLAAEVVRLNKLCKENGIDPMPPGTQPGATMSVEPKIQVFSNHEDAEKAMKESQNTS